MVDSGGDFVAIAETDLSLSCVFFLFNLLYKRITAYWSQEADLNNKGNRESDHIIKQHFRQS